MLPWHVPYFGWTRLPFDVSEFEITHFFSLQPEEGSAVLTRYRESLHLGAALQIGFLKMCGRPNFRTPSRRLRPSALVVSSFVVAAKTPVAKITSVLVT